MTVRNTPIPSKIQVNEQSKSSSSSAVVGFGQLVNWVYLQWFREIRECSIGHLRLNFDDVLFDRLAVGQIFLAFHLVLARIAEWNHCMSNGGKGSNKHTKTTTQRTNMNAPSHRHSPSLSLVLPTRPPETSSSSGISAALRATNAGTVGKRCWYRTAPLQ